MASLLIGTALAALAGIALGDEPHATNATSYNNLDAYGVPSPFQEYRSHPGLKSPIFLVNELNQDLIGDEGYLFFAAKYDFGSPYIVSARDLSLVYADPSYDRAFDVRAQEIDGERFLTFWQGGHRTPGVADGFCLLTDENYQLRYNITAQNLEPGVLSDLHELKVTNDGTVLMTVYNPIKYDLTALGGEPEEDLIDGVFQEVDPTTGELLFSWSSVQHIDVTKTVVTYAEGQNGVGGIGFDYYHINSVDKSSNGNYLVSGRHVSLVSLISGQDGSIIWSIGSNGGDFVDPTGGSAVAFAYQHDARFVNPDDETEITLFDNHRSVIAAGCTAECSRGLRIKLDPEAKTATIVKEFFHPASFHSGWMGGYQTLPSNENAVIAWGSHASITEHTIEGQVAMNIQIATLMQENTQGVYRAYKMDWEGKPTWDPRIAGNNLAQDARVYVSWNGASNVAHWVVYGSDSQIFQISEDLELASSDRLGFETEIALGQAPRYVAAVAHDGNNETLGMTGVMDITTGDMFDKPEPEAKAADDSENDDNPNDNPDDVLVPESGAGAAAQIGVWSFVAAVGVAVFMNTL